MRKLLYCLILMSAVANSGLFVPMLTATNNGESSSRLHSSASTDRPESGVPLWIDCHYNSGEMRFDAPETFNDVEVVITELNTGCSFTYYLTNGEASLFVELNSGAYSILYITEKGVYEGCLDIP